MVTITESAKNKIRTILDDQGDVPAIRVYISGVGCAGNSWSLQVDDVGEDDHVHEEDGIRIIGDQALLEEAGGLTVDYQVTREGAGFRVLTDKEPRRSCGSGCHC